MYYELIGDENAQKYFYVDPDRGVISLKQSILSDDQDQYEVRSRFGTIHTLDQFNAAIFNR